jgi:hypothetical protein
MVQEVDEVGQADSGEFGVRRTKHPLTAVDVSLKLTALYVAT